MISIGWAAGQMESMTSVGDVSRQRGIYDLNRAESMTSVGDVDKGEDYDLTRVGSMTSIGDVGRLLTNKMVYKRRISHSTSKENQPKEPTKETKRCLYSRARKIKIAPRPSLNT